MLIVIDSDNLDFCSGNFYPYLGSPHPHMPGSEQQPVASQGSVIQLSPAALLPEDLYEFD